MIHPVLPQPWMSCRLKMSPITANSIQKNRIQQKKISIDHMTWPKFQLVATSMGAPRIDGSVCRNYASHSRRAPHPFQAIRANQAERKVPLCVFARVHTVETTADGHDRGLELVQEILPWLRDCRGYRGMLRLASP